jgi:hypothetical protein
LQVKHLLFPFPELGEVDLRQQFMILVKRPAAPSFPIPEAVAVVDDEWLLIINYVNTYIYI